MSNRQLLSDVEKGERNSVSEIILERLYKYLSCEEININKVEGLIDQNEGILEKGYKSYRGKNVLQIACSNLAKNISKNGNVRVLEKLITRSNLIYSNEAEDFREAIHYAASSGQTEILRAIIDAIKADEANSNRINATTCDGDTALCVMMKQKPSKSMGCIKLLVDSGIDVDVANNDNCTAVLLGCKKILNYSKPYNSDSERGIQDMEEIIKLLMSKNCDIDSHCLNRKSARMHVQSLMQKKILHDFYLKDKAESSDQKNSVFGLLKEGRQEEFLSHPHLSTYIKSDDGTVNLMQLACLKGFEKCVQKLLDMGADVDCKTNKSDYPLSIAGKQGFFEIFSLIIKKSKVDASRVLLDVSKNLYQRRSRKVDHERCLEMLLEHRRNKIDVNRQDDEGSTPLHCTTKMRKAVASMSLLKAGALLGVRNDDGIMPVDDIDIGTLEKYFNYCIYYKNYRVYNNPWLTDEEKNAQKTIEINYTSLLPPDIKPSSHVEVIAQISRIPELTSVLKHPYISTFLYLKWHRIRWIHYINILGYAVFCLLLYVQIFFTYLNENNTNIILSVLLGIVVSCLILRETVQFTSRPKSYFHNFENWMEMVLFLLTLLIVFNYPSDIAMRKQLAAVAILLSAMELVLSLGQIPEFATNVKMLKTVSWNFIKFIIWHFMLLLGFALSFYILFNKSIATNTASIDQKTNSTASEDDGDLDFFQNLSLSIVKAVVMLTGEFDAASIRFQIYPLTSIIIFLSFVFMISMVVFNLLNGLAISDIQEIQRHAEIVANQSRLQYILTVESLYAKIACFNCKLLRDFFFELIYSNSKFIKQGKLLLTGRGTILQQQVSEVQDEEQKCGRVDNLRRYWIWLVGQFNFEVELDGETFGKIKHLVEVTKIEERYSREQTIIKNQKDLEERQKEMLKEQKIMQNELRRLSEKTCDSISKIERKITEETNFEDALKGLTEEVKSLRQLMEENR